MSPVCICVREEVLRIVIIPPAFSGRTCDPGKVSWDASSAAPPALQSRHEDVLNEDVGTCLAPISTSDEGREIQPAGEFVLCSRAAAVSG